MENLIKTNGSKNYWWIPLISGLTLLFFGVWFFKAPLDSFQTLTLVFGFIILLSGILEIYVAFTNKGVVVDYLSYVWGGVLNVFLGFLLILNPTTILIIISIVIGFWLIYKGGELIKKAMELKKVKNEKWKTLLIVGSILILIAVILLWHPQIIGFTIALWTSLAFIILGIFRIYFAFKLKGLKS